MPHISSLDILLQLLGCHLHLSESKPLLAEVFQRGSYVIDGIVDAEEAVVDFAILPIVCGNLFSLRESWRGNG